MTTDVVGQELTHHLPPRLPAGRCK